MPAIKAPVSSFNSAGVPPHGMGLTMEGRGHTLRNSFMQETSYNTHTGEGKIMMTCVCVDIAPGMYLYVLNVLMVCSWCYIVVPTIWPPTVRNWYTYSYKLIDSLSFFA